MLSVVKLSLAIYLLLCWMSLCWVSLRWMSLCWMSLCWMSLCWMSLCWMSLCWMSLCWVSWCLICRFFYQLHNHHYSKHCYLDIKWNIFFNTWKTLAVQDQTKDNQLTLTSLIIWQPNLQSASFFGYHKAAQSLKFLIAKKLVMRLCHPPDGSTSPQV